MRVTANHSFNDSGEVVDSEVVIRMDVKEAKAFFFDLVDISPQRAEGVTKGIRNSLRNALGIK